jgi:hypothetical protein
MTTFTWTGVIDMASSSSALSSQTVPVSSMKVNELRFQLKRRGLPQTGSKDVLAERLRGILLLDGQDHCVISTPVSRVRSKGERTVTKDYENVPKEGQEVAKGVQDVSTSREKASGVSSIHVCDCANFGCIDVAKAIETLKGLIQKQSQSFNTFMLSMREEIRSIVSKVNSKPVPNVDTFVAKLVPIVDNINVLSNQVDGVSERIARCFVGYKDGHRSEYPNMSHGRVGHDYNSWMGSNHDTKKYAMHVHLGNVSGKGASACASDSAYNRKSVGNVRVKPRPSSDSSGGNISRRYSPTGTMTRSITNLYWKGLIPLIQSQSLVE